MRNCRALIALLLLAASWPASAVAQSGENILLVTNALSQASDEIGTYYARKRGVPGNNILRLPLSTEDEITRAAYQDTIERPIVEWLVGNAAQDRILYIVLTKGVPLRIAGTSGQNGTVASVDSELTLVYRGLVGNLPPPAGSVPNPVFQRDGAPATASRFTHQRFDLYLVTRLDGYTVDDVKGLIERALSPSREGVIVLDGKFEVTQSVGNRWLTAAAEAVKKLYGWSNRVIADTAQNTIDAQPKVLGFYTWGSNAVAASLRHYGHTFVNGAIAAEYVSTDARTFKEPPSDWVINDTKKPFGGSHQSLIGDLIRDGVTGAAGHVAEPLLNATIRPDLLFPAYLSGFNLAESFYMAMPSVGWQTIVVGDPLCAPLGPRPFPLSELNPPVDPDTELPEFLSKRRLAVLATTGAKPDVAKWIARAEVRQTKKDGAGTRLAYEKASEIDPSYFPANLALAAIYESASEWDAAIDRYQRIIDRSPNHVPALNNLAWLLAVRKGKASEAFPLASKAYVLSVQDPNVGDTLAWVYHLMNNDTAAEPLITISARRLPGSEDAQIHAAIIHAAVGRMSAASEYLAAALKLNSKLAERDDVKALQQRLASAK